MSVFSSPLGPFIILIIGILVVVGLIYKMKVNPFIALMTSAIVVGLLTPNIPIMDGSSRLLSSIELPMLEFGKMAGKISWVIALAAIIGVAMLESGAAEKIVSVIIKTIGEKRADWALLLSGLILSIPVFFDTVFFLLIPLAIALAKRTGKNFTLYVVAIAGGAIITHGLVPPTPGPLIVADSLGIDLGQAIIFGLGFSILPGLAVIFIGRRINNNMNIPIRVESMDSTHLSNPSFLLSIAPIAIPIILIACVSISNVALDTTPEFIKFLGNKNIAMAIGGILAMFLWSGARDLKGAALWQEVIKPLEIAGIIILITCAGGAFGAMIKHTGIGDAIQHFTSDVTVNYLLLAWIIAAVMKTAQGSSTVAMITAASIISSMIEDGGSLSYHPIYLMLSIGFGAGFISWMNDSAFWVVSKMAGFTEGETLKSWTVIYAAIALVGLFQVLIFSLILPLV